VKHGGIPQPDRSVDNSTYWVSDFTPQHYRDMLFSDGGASYGHPSMRDFYKELSSGRFTWEGQVSNWVALPNTLAYYGANLRTSGAGGDDAFGPTSKVVKDTVQTLTPGNAFGGLNLGLASASPMQARARRAAGPRTRSGAIARTPT
jgi:bacillopeptidase F (M6 metalloprotease family)